MLLLDADFVPDAQLWPFVCAAGPAAATHCIAERAVLVLPAFEARRAAAAESLSEGELRRCHDVVARAANMEARDVAAACGAGGPLQVFAERVYPRGHAATQTARWCELALLEGGDGCAWRPPYRVRHEEGYEPFLLACRWHLPAFDERLVGYSKNKLAHAARLAACGFTFDVLPGHFVVHRAHPASDDYERTFGAAAGGSERAQRVHGLYLASLVAALLPDPGGSPPGHSGCAADGGSRPLTVARRTVAGADGAKGGACLCVVECRPPRRVRWSRSPRARPNSGSGAEGHLPMGRWAPRAPDLAWLVAGVRSGDCVCGLSPPLAADLLRAAVDVHCCTGHAWAVPPPPRPLPDAPAALCIALATLCSVDRWAHAPPPCPTRCTSLTLSSRWHRLHRIPDVCALWEGPICAAVLRPRRAVAAAAAELRVRALRRVRCIPAATAHSPLTRRLCTAPRPPEAWEWPAAYSALCAGGHR